MSKAKLFLLFTVLLSFVMSEQAKSQDVHGYAMVLANELSDHNFIVTNHGYVNDTVDLYEVRLETPEFYDEELTRTVITSVMSGYSDVKRYEPWERSYGGTSSSYRINDTKLDISIFEHSTDSYGLNQGCTVLLFEFINPDWVKSKYTGTKKKTTKPSKKKSTKRK